MATRDNPSVPPTTTVAIRRRTALLVGILVAFVVLAITACITARDQPSTARMGEVPTTVGPASTTTTSRDAEPPEVSATTAAQDSAVLEVSEQGFFHGAYRTEPIQINQMHSWTLHVETPNGRPVENAEITVDGDMPEHGHGLPTQPKVTRNLGNGDYLVEGMKFQMGGRWVVDFHITAGGQRDVLRFNLQL